MGKELERAIKISGKLDKSLNSAVRNAQTQLNTLGKNGGRALTALSGAFVVAGAKIAKDSIEAYQSYESALNSAAAVAGFEKGTKEYEMMNAAAREAGRTTVKTAEDSAHALEYMALAGWSVEDSTKALMPVLKLSAAANMDLATTSDLVTDTMAAMGLGINDLGRYLDVLTKANNSANHNSQELLESYAGVGGVLRNLNVPIEKSAAVLGVMADQSLKGSEAGTALNAILVNMQKKSGDSFKAMSKLGVSMYDSAGNARDLLAVFQDIHDKTASMTTEQRNLMYQMIGGKAHVDDFAKIMNGFTESAETGTVRVYELEKAYGAASGTLDKFYDIKTSTFEAAVTKLQSAYNDMLIEIGGSIIPGLNEAVEGLTNNMPNIQNAILNVFNEVVPVMSNALIFAANNADKIIKVVTGTVKAFLMFKALKGAVNIAKLAKDINTLVKAAGGLTTLKGVIGTLTGIGSAGSAAGAGLASIGAAASGIGILAAAVAGGVIAYKIWDKATYHWADNLAGLEKPIERHANSIERLNSLSGELGELQLIINSPDSSAEQITTAQTRLQEIADLLEQEYGLHINVDDTGLSEAAEQVHEIINALSYKEHVDLAKSTAKYIDELTGLIPTYKESVASIPEKMSTYNQAAAANTAVNGSNGAWSNLQFATTNYDLTGDINKYAERARNAVQQVLDAGLTTEFAEAGFNYGLTAIDGMADALKTGDASRLMLNEGDIEKVRQTMNDLANNTTTAFDQANKELEAARGNIAEFDRVSNKASEDLAKALRSDVLLGNTEQAENVTNQFRQLGETIAAAGASTDILARNFALANSGFTDMSAAIEAGGIQKVATDFLNFQLSIGQSAASAVQGAALIANGFDSVEVAAAAGDAAVNAIIADMARLGAAQGMFNGLDNAGIAAKLSEMAQAMNLIPDNKQVVVNATGNFEVIERAQQAADNLNGTQANANLGANDNATPTVEKVQQAVDKLNSTTAQPTLAANDQATSVINSVSGKLDGLNGKTATTTIITEYKTKGTPPGNSATGTNFWRGGLTYVNDQRGVSDPRELITYGGRAWWYNGRDILADIPRGARILTAAESRAYINGSHRNGLERVPFDGYVAELHEGERVLTADQADGYGVTIDDMLDIVAGMTGSGQQQNDGGGQQIIFSPQITIAGGGDKETVMAAMRMSYSEFREYMQEYERDTRRRVFG